MTLKISVMSLKERKDKAIEAIKSMHAERFVKGGELEILGYITEIRKELDRLESLCNYNVKIEMFTMGC